MSTLTADLGAAPAKDVVRPPIEPMLAKLADELPPEGDYLYEPKWDGFRAIVFRDRKDVYIQSRDLRPLDRYFPELHDMLLERLPPECVLDGEIVIATKQGLDFDALQLRLHPAASRVAKLAKETPSSFVAFDVLERHADLAEGHADALSLGGPPKSLDEEIAELRNSEKVDAELEALKASLAKRTNGGEAQKKGE